MRILIADDHGVFREGLKALIDNEADMEVVGEAIDGIQVIKLAKELLPDIVVMDISMPNLNGVEATRIILEENPDIRIIALSVHYDKHFITEMLRAGASGYVLKASLFDEVLRAIRAVSSNAHYLSPKITDIVLDDYKYYMSVYNKSSENRLTSRERQVVQFLAEGQTIKQIALHLHVSPKTIQANRSQIMEKLNISGIAELTKYAIREGLTSAEF